MVTVVHSDSILPSHIVFTNYLGISDANQNVQLYILFNNDKTVMYLQGMAMYVPKNDWLYCIKFSNYPCLIKSTWYS